MAKVTEKVKRLLALEREMVELRRDLNTGVGKLLAGLDRLNNTIEHVAALRPRLEDLEARVRVLERKYA
jgi:ubiquinone biosynthesis protein UbiJ